MVVNKYNLAAVFGALIQIALVPFFAVWLDLLVAFGLIFVIATVLYRRGAVLDHVYIWASSAGAGATVAALVIIWIRAVS